MLPWKPSAGTESVGGAPPTAPAAPTPMNLASTLFFLQSEHRRYNRDRNEWEIERAEMRARLALLEGEKRGNEGAIRDLGRRCKMLESALRNERSKFLSSATGPNHTPSPSGTSSPLQIPHPLPLKPKDGSPPPTNTSLPSTRAPSAPQPNGSNNIGGGTQSSLAPGPAASRDPRGRARSRDYLKQCLQEITYLTSSSTLNPLSSTSYAAPALVRPRKILSDYPAPPSGIPLNSTAPPMVNSNSNLNPTSQAGLFSLASSNNGYNPSTLNGARPTPDAATNYPSDPASVFVPLTRQGSLQGSRGSSIRAIELEAERPDAAEREREGRESREAREGAGTTTSFMAVKPPPPAPPVTPAPPPNESTPDVPQQLSEPPEEEDDEVEEAERTIETNDPSLAVNSIDDDEPPPPFLGDSGRRGSLSARGGARGAPDLFAALRTQQEAESDHPARELPSPPVRSSVDDIDDDDPPNAPFEESDSLYSAASYSNNASSRLNSFDNLSPSRHQGMYGLRDFGDLTSGKREDDSFISRYGGTLRDMLNENSERKLNDDLPNPVDAEDDDDDDPPAAADEDNAEENEEGKSGLVWENEAGEVSEEAGEPQTDVESMD